MADPGEAGVTTESELREKAVRRVKQKRDFRGHLLTYIAVNGFLIVIWAVGDAGFFWPMFPLLGWGIFGIVPHAWSVYGRNEISEDQIQREMDKLR